MPYQVSLVFRTFTDILPSLNSSPMKIGIRYSAFSGFPVLPSWKTPWSPPPGHPGNLVSGPTYSWKPENLHQQPHRPLLHRLQSLQYSWSPQPPSGCFPHPSFRWSDPKMSIKFLTWNFYGDFAWVISQKDVFLKFLPFCIFTIKLIFWNFYAKISYMKFQFPFFGGKETIMTNRAGTLVSNLSGKCLWIFSTDSASTESSYWGVWWAFHETYAANKKRAMLAARWSSFLLAFCSVSW